MVGMAREKLQGMPKRVADEEASRPNHLPADPVQAPVAAEGIARHYILGEVSVRAQLAAVNQRLGRVEQRVGLAELSSDQLKRLPSRESIRTGKAVQVSAPGQRGKKRNLDSYLGTIII